MQERRRRDGARDDVAGGDRATCSANLGPSYRVEAVDTATHSAAVYLADAGIPLARGWYRQDDFPQNEVLYDKLGREGVPRAGCAGSACAYVVLAHATPDYSSRGEAALVRSGRLGLLRGLPHARADDLRGAARAADHHRAGRRRRSRR